MHKAPYRIGIAFTSQPTATTFYVISDIFSLIISIVYASIFL